jgi:uncharacterized protein YndB with AHSA1/START domain
MLIMETANKITVSTTINLPVEKVWESWNKPEHIKQWTHASDDWHTTYAANDLRKDGKFKTTMAARDGSLSFDFEGVYTNVIAYKLLAYTLEDGREVTISFNSKGDTTQVVETFDPEQENSIEMQQSGWQAILDNFKKYTERSF